MTYRLVVLLFFSSLSIVNSQDRGWELGGDVGLTHYFGDLNTEFDFLHPGVSLSVKTRYNINKRLAFGGGVRYAFIHGRDEWAENVFQQSRNLGFRSHNFEAFTQFEFNFLPYQHGKLDDNFTPYIFAGPMIARIDPQNKLVDSLGNETWYHLRDYNTEGQIINQSYSAKQFAINYGFGIKYNLNSKWSINAELSGRKFFTDYIDDVSTVYPNKEQLLNDNGPIAVLLSDPSYDNELFPNLGEEGRQRGNAKTTDMYTSLSIGIMYYFSFLPCPEESRIRY